MRAARARPVPPVSIFRPAGHAPAVGSAGPEGGRDRQKRFGMLGFHVAEPDADVAVALQQSQKARGNVAGRDWEVPAAAVVTGSATAAVNKNGREIAPGVISLRSAIDANLQTRVVFVVSLGWEFAVPWSGCPRGCGGRDATGLNTPAGQERWTWRGGVSLPHTSGAWRGRALVLIHDVIEPGASPGYRVSDGRQEFNPWLGFPDWGGEFGRSCRTSG